MKEQQIWTLLSRLSSQDKHIEVEPLGDFNLPSLKIHLNSKSSRLSLMSRGWNIAIVLDVLLEAECPDLFISKAKNLVSLCVVVVIYTKNNINLVGLALFYVFTTNKLQDMLLFQKFIRKMKRSERKIIRGQIFKVAANIWPYHKADGHWICRRKIVQMCWTELFNPLWKC